MAGTNAVAAKKALLDKIAGFLPDIQVMYSWPGKIERECVHGGKVEGTQQYATFAGGRARLPRDEQFTVHIFVAVYILGADDGYAPELRMTEIGQLIEDGIAADPQFESVAGMLFAGITSIEMESYPDDDGWSGDLDYGITVRSRLN